MKDEMVGINYLPTYLHTRCHNSSPYDGYTSPRGPHRFFDQALDTRKPSSTIAFHSPPSANITRTVKTFTTNKERFRKKKKKHYIISWWHWGVRSDEADSVNSSISKSRGICFFELYDRPLITAESSIWLRRSGTRYKRSGFIIYLFFFIWLFNIPPLLYLY